MGRTTRSGPTSWSGRPRLASFAATHVGLVRKVNEDAFLTRSEIGLWAGDSRLYRLRAESFERLTRDHSEVQVLLDYGLISADEARWHPRGNIVTPAVGAEDVLQLQELKGEVQPGDAFLLCTDGLTRVVEDPEIGIALSVLSAIEAVHTLIETALQRGAPDNVSVAVIKIASTELF